MMTSTLSKEEKRKLDIAQQQENCEHKHIEFSHSYEDWIDGDSEDISICKDCGKWFYQYIGR